MNLNILSWNILSNKWIRPEFYNNIDIKALNDPNRYIKIIGQRESSIALTKCRKLIHFLLISLLNLGENTF
jgi:hypothetical protein